MDRTEMLKQFRSKLESLGLPYERLEVYGRIRLNVSVVCASRDTADKWSRVLMRVLGDNKAIPHEWTWEAKENKGTCLRPTMRKGWLIVGAQ